MALSVTFFPETGRTFAIFFGCDDEADRIITSRISMASRAAVHPLLLVGVFAEIERTRQIELVERSIDALETRILNLDDEAFPRQHYENSPSRSVINEDLIEFWLNTSHLRNGLETWKAQLQKVVDEVGDLEIAAFDTEGPTEINGSTINRAEYRALMRKTGKKIKERLRSTINVYEEKIRECTTRVDGMTMATQLVSSLF